ncbi:MAG: malto-oligosyltrehalose synthase [Nitrospiraceae bacterium]|nr:malto-oligosyltrehalose synthase [Nitrospiraceae bacterium]
MQPDDKKILRLPCSTYRLQFNRNFKFTDAKAIIPYLGELGITDIYSSPYFKARPGSLHGYDIIRHDELNPEVGTEAQHAEMCMELKKNGMGQVMDIVPNHMCILGDNRWWQDVLENGRSSAYANFFDIDWTPLKQSLREKVLLPVLGEQYGKVLESGELRLNFKDGSFFISYYENTFPVEPCSYELVLRHRLEELEARIAGSEALQDLMSIITALDHLPPHTETDAEKVRERSREKEVIKRRLSALYDSSRPVARFIDENVSIFNGAKENPRSFDLLDALLSRQPYRLSQWKVATEEINYRRFFDVNELAALRVEEPDVFMERHKLVLKLVKERKATGLRVDHVDGLYNPADYFRTLQKEAAAAASGAAERAQIKEYVSGELSRQDSKPPFYVIGEKILLKGERLPEDWPIYGSTGYDFLNMLNGIFANAESSDQLSETYSRFIGGSVNFPMLVYDEKKLIMESSMSGEINVLGHRLSQLAEKSRRTRDFTVLSLTKAIIEVMACFPVYRTYTTASGVNDRDRRYVELAVRKAKRMNPAISGSVFDFLKSALLLEYPAEFTDEDRAEWLNFVMRFQQQSGPVMAKALEDTAFYVYNVLLSLNEVGGAPERFGTSLEAFHGQNIERAKSWPFCLTASTTHDSKRSEDVRARINVITEMPDKWRDAVTEWSRLNKDKKTVLDNRPVPDRNEEYHFYQTLLGVWPLDDDPRQIAERLKQYNLKALREAKVNSSWVDPDTAYEDAFMAFIDAVLEPGDFLGSFAPFARMVSFYGMLNSLSQVLLKAASPGVPDFYQGTELWHFHLVDPDNRGPVDYKTRIKLFGELKAAESAQQAAGLCKNLLASMQDGRIKFFITWKALNFRKAHENIFMGGEYVPLEAEGTYKENVCAFIKKENSGEVLVAAPRFYSRLVGPGVLPVGPEVWKDTVLILPEGTRPEDQKNVFRDVFTQDETAAKKTGNGKTAIKLGELFRDFPLCLASKAG